MLCRRILLNNRKPFFQTLFRTFLSKEYKCQTEWESRLTSPLMQKIKIDTLYYEIDQAFNQNGKASAIDIDIFVNKVNDDSHIDEMVDLIHRLRRTEETSNSLESTGHAVCRNFIEYNHIDDLLQILDNPLEYGVFLDNYIANLIMDECIKRENYMAAARIATFQMLQENFDNDLTRYLSLYSCLKYLSSNPQPFYPPKEEKDDDTEVVKVRVKYIRNEYFDDHFDLKNHFHLVGKTLAMIGAANMKEGDGIAKSSELLGHVLYQKYDKAINTLKSSSSNNFYKNIIEQCITHLDSNPPDEKSTKLHNEIHSLLNSTLTKTDLIQNNLHDDIEKFIKESITKNEINEIEKQKEIYKMWNEIRLKRFNDEVKRIQKEQRIKNIEKLLNDMKDEEQKLWFFENEEKINLQIENRKEQEITEKIIDVKKKTKDDDENYVPPEVIKHRK